MEYLFPAEIQSGYLPNTWRYILTRSTSICIEPDENHAKDLDHDTQAGPIHQQTESNIFWLRSHVCVACVDTHSSHADRWRRGSMHLSRLHVMKQVSGLHNSRASSCYTEMVVECSRSSVPPQLHICGQ